MRKNCTEWWINHFKDLRNRGLHCDADILHDVDCLRYCYMLLIRQELQIAAIQWNLHRIRPSTNPNSTPGRPDTLYLLPSCDEIRDHNCKRPVDDDEIDFAKELSSSDPSPDC